MPQIRLKSGPGKGKIHQITTDSLKIGRETTCQIQLLESGVSREHAEIYRVGEMYFVRDLGSRNGTTVNDLNIEDELLRDGDVVQISNCMLVFEGSRPDQPGSPSGAEEDSFFQEDLDPAATLTLRYGPSSGAAASSNRKLSSSLVRLKKLSTEPHEQQALYDEVLDIVFQLLEVEQAFIFILDADQKLYNRAYRAAKDVKRSKVSKTIVLRCMKERRTILTANAREDFRFKSESSIMMLDVASVMCCPLIALGRELGVIYLCNGPDKPSFSEEDTEFVDIVACHLALLYSCSDSNTRMRDIHRKSIQMLEHAVETLIPQLSGRGERVYDMVKVLGQELGLKSRQSAALSSAAHLHHVGYLSLLRDREITRDYLMTDTVYVTKSVELLSGYGGHPDIIEIVRHHRARLDGKGFSGNLKPEEWRTESQILALAVDLDLRINMPMVFNEEDLPLNEIVQQFLKDGVNIVGSEVLKSFEGAYKNGLLLGD